MRPPSKTAALVHEVKNASIHIIPRRFTVDELFDDVRAGSADDAGAGRRFVT